MPAPPQDQVLIAFGSNQGDRRSIIMKALDKISEAAGEIVACSKFYETAPIGAADELFINGALVVRTALAPERLMDALLQIERQLGRVRTIKWGNRSIDLDIILWKKADGSMLEVDSEHLQVPHPRALDRSFVLEPACEVAADWIFRRGFTVERAWGELRGNA